MIEQADEVPRIIEASRNLGAPLIGVRAKLSTRSTAASSSLAKFGLSIPDLLATVGPCEADLLSDLRLCTFTWQPDQRYRRALGHCKRASCMAHSWRANGISRCAGTVDYDGSRSATAASTNYSLQNYANDVVATIRECCEPQASPCPRLAAQAIASHFSVLVFNVLGHSGSAAQPSLTGLMMRRSLWESASSLPGSAPTTCRGWNDALKFKDDALAAFRLGYLSPLRACRAALLGLLQCHRRSSTAKRNCR